MTLEKKCVKCGNPVAPMFTSYCLDCWSQVMTERYGYEGSDMSTPGSPTKPQQEKFNPIPLVPPTESDKEN